MRVLILILTIMAAIAGALFLFWHGEEGRSPESLKTSAVVTGGVVESQPALALSDGTKQTAGGQGGAAQQLSGKLETQVGTQAGEARGEPPPQSGSFKREVIENIMFLSPDEVESSLLFNPGNVQLNGEEKVWLEAVIRLGNEKIIEAHKRTFRRVARVNRQRLANGDYYPMPVREDGTWLPPKPDFAGQIVGQLRVEGRPVFTRINPGDDLETDKLAMEEWRLKEALFDELFGFFSHPGPPPDFDPEASDGSR